MSKAEIVFVLETQKKRLEKQLITASKDEMLLLYPQLTDVQTRLNTMELN